MQVQLGKEKVKISLRTNVNANETGELRPRDHGNQRKPDLQDP